MDYGKRIAKAKTSLILEHPFIGSVALNMPTVITDSVPTAATNGKRIAFNPEFLDKLTDEQVKFLVAHECMHPMLEHNFRRGERNPKKWNMAADYVINKLLVDEKIGKFIDGGCLSDDIYRAGGGTSDGIYNMLPDMPEGSGGGGGDGIGGPGEDLEDSPGSPAEQAQDAAEWRVKVAQAAQAAKMMGKLSAGMERLVAQILRPKVDWREVLRRFVQKAKTDERSFARPNRRFQTQGLYLPSISGDRLGEMLVAVDCSGSIGERELAEFATEIMTMHEDGKPSALHVVYFDSRVSHYDKFGPDDTVTVAPHGGGGTAFSPIFAYADKHDMAPVACVVLTDLYCDDFGPAPDYPVLWVSNGSERAPWGEVVKL